MEQPHQTVNYDRNLALELVRVSEAGALAASRWMGRGNKNEADGAAVEAMRRAFDSVAIDGTVVIGEGEMDEAPMLYIGEKVGSGGPAMDIAVDPLEGTTITAKGGPNAMATVALAEARQFPARARHLHGQDRRGPRPCRRAWSIWTRPVAENLRNLAAAKKTDIGELVLCTLDRDRHAEMIAKAREAGARIMLIGDGDVSGVIMAAQAESGVDIFIGSGGAPEGVFWRPRPCAAWVGKCRAACCSRTTRRSPAPATWAWPIQAEIRPMLDMAKGDVMFAATGVTTGPMLRGVRRFSTGAVTHSLVMRSKSGHGPLCGGAP